MAEINLKDFEEWLRGKGMAITTIANYSTHIRRAFSRIGSSSPTKDQLDFYASRLATNQRNIFRSGWRHFAAFSEETGKPIATVSSGRLGRPSEVIGERIEDYAIEYLNRTIPSDRLADLRWYSDVDLISPADAVIWDPPGRSKYFVHRRPLDVLLVWGHPDGAPYGAIVPAEPGAHVFMNSAEIEDRAREARKNETPLDPVAAFIRRVLPNPRREVWDPREAPRPPVDPKTWKP